MTNKVENVLLELGVTPNLMGFAYICQAIRYIWDDKKAKMGYIYGRIAQEYGTTCQRTERAIRHAISKMDNESEAWKKYVGITNLKNSAVLHALAMKLREE